MCTHRILQTNTTPIQNSTRSTICNNREGPKAGHVKKCVEMGQEIIGELIEFNLTSYLRTKFDQAKRAAQKLEYVDYELSLRN